MLHRDNNCNIPDFEENKENCSISKKLDELENKIKELELSVERLETIVVYLELTLEEYIQSE